ncbi:MAG: hypothetical protein AAF614_22595 [Chloroflexota bacterium]
MEIGPVFLVFALVVIVFLIANEHVETKRRGRRHITAVIKDHGGTEIWVSQGSGFGEHKTIIYEVAFRDVNGVTQRTRCKWEFSKKNAGTIYWKDEPFLPGYRVQLKETRTENAQMRSQLMHRSMTKEQIISDLVHKNEELEAELKALKTKVLAD